MEAAFYKTMQEFGPPFLAAGATMIISKLTLTNVGALAVAIVGGLFWANYRAGKKAKKK